MALGHGVARALGGHTAGVAQGGGVLGHDCGSGQHLKSRERTASENGSHDSCMRVIQPTQKVMDGSQVQSTAAFDTPGGIYGSVLRAFAHHL